jgi:nucleotide-binding universal stress UspA family protein
VIALAGVPVLAVPPDDWAVPDSQYGAYDHVLIPTDGSDAAERAAGHGLAVAERYGADVHAVYVVDTTTYGLEDAPRSVVGLLKEGGENAVEAVAAEARDRNLPVTTDVLRGVPEEELLSYADGVGADLVVMGTRGRAAGDDRLLGSTTARVLRRSTVPVLAVG